MRQRTPVTGVVALLVFMFPAAKALGEEEGTEKVPAPPTQEAKDTPDGRGRTG